MVTDQSSQAEPMEPKKSGLEVPPKFIPTPERLSQYLEINLEEVMTHFESVEGREKLYNDLIEHEDDLRELDPTLEPALLKEQLDLVSETLSQKKKYLEDVRSPEKKGIFRRAWDKVKGFAKKHPVVTTLLVLAIAAGATAGGYYLAANWELVMAQLSGIPKIFSGAEAAGELLSPTPPTPPLPGGGIPSVPGPGGGLGPI